MWIPRSRGGDSNRVIPAKAGIQVAEMDPCLWGVTKVRFSFLWVGLGPMTTRNDTAAEEGTSTTRPRIG
jgi:hypothetical protein